MTTPSFRARRSCRASRQGVATLSVSGRVAVYALGAVSLLFLAACGPRASDQIIADGTIELTQVNIARFVAGRVVAVRVHEGGTVTRGMDALWRDTLALAALAVVLIAFSVRRFQKNIE